MVIRNKLILAVNNNYSSFSPSHKQAIILYGIIYGW